MVTPAQTDIAEHPPRVLVADDEPNIRNLLAAALGPQGYEVVAARDGNEAKLLLEREPFEAVITDYRMPGLNGIDVLRLAKLTNAACQVVIITGHHGPEVQQKAMDWGAADYIQKPFSLEAINNAVALQPGDAAELDRAAAGIDASLAEKDEQIGQLRAALRRSEIGGGGGGDSDEQPRAQPPLEDRVLRCLRDHPDGADFDTLEAATGVSGRNIVSTMARLIDTGMIRREFPLFFPVE